MVDTQLSSRIELFIAASDLANKDLLSKSDPFCVVLMKVPGFTQSVSKAVLSLLNLLQGLRSMNGRAWTT